MTKYRHENLCNMGPLKCLFELRISLTVLSAEFANTAKRHCAFFSYLSIIKLNYSSYLLA